MRRRWRIEAHRLPPYGVCSSETLTPEDVFRIEEMIHQKSPAEAMTRRFVGTRLPDLFKEVYLPVDGRKNPEKFRKNSPRLFLSLGQSFRPSPRYSRPIRHAILAEPHMLWQFVLNPEKKNWICLPKSGDQKTPISLDRPFCLCCGMESHCLETNSRLTQKVSALFSFMDQSNRKPP
jgi:hypothetical protein